MLESGDLTLLPDGIISLLPAAAAVLAALSSALLLVAVKPAYERFLRRDAPCDPALMPVLRRLKRPVHACHRGGCKVWPENTMVAFRNAVQPSVDSHGQQRRTQMIEFDIQKTRGGEMIIMHNLTVDETTEGSGRVADLTFDEIRQLDAGYRFSTDGGKTFPFRGQGVQVPTLRELLSEFVSYPDLVFSFDFKSPDAVADALQLAREFGIEERLVVGAVPPAANKEVLRLKPPFVPATPDINSMILMYAAFLCNLLWLLPMRHEIVGTTPFRWGYKVLTPNLVRAFHQRGRLMAVFGDYLDTEEGQLDCISMGCDILVTDRPDVLHSALEKWSLEAFGRPKESSPEAAASHSDG